LIGIIIILAAAKALGNTAMRCLSKQTRRSNRCVSYR
jgi:hypothetical protein